MLLAISTIKRVHPIGGVMSWEPRIRPPVISHVQASAAPTLVLAPIGGNVEDEGACNLNSPERQKTL